MQIYNYIYLHIYIAVFNTVMTLINQIVQIHGYSNDDAGLFGAMIVLFGLIGAAIISVLMQKTKAYMTILKIGFALAVIGMLAMLGMLSPDNFDLLLSAFCFLGKFIYKCLYICIIIT